MMVSILCNFNMLKKFHKESSTSDFLGFQQPHCMGSTIEIFIQQTHCIWSKEEIGNKKKGKMSLNKKEMN